MLLLETKCSDTKSNGDLNPLHSKGFNCYATPQQKVKKRKERKEVWL